uniref:Uncharacterized protein n=1 Tax=Anopheles atroparvus TaxID=41427 RepID=A0AAG5DIS6_ANOAO
VHHVLHTLQLQSAQLALNHEVVGSDHAGAIYTYLDETTLVDQVTDSLQRRVTVRNVGFRNAQHVLGGLVQLDECAIVDLTQTEQLQHLTHLRGYLVDTGNLRLGRNVDVAGLLGSASLLGDRTFQTQVLLRVACCTQQVLLTAQQAYGMQLAARQQHVRTTDNATLGKLQLRLRHRRQFLAVGGSLRFLLLQRLFVTRRLFHGFLRFGSSLRLISHL